MSPGTRSHKAASEVDPFNAVLRRLNAPETIVETACRLDVDAIVDTPTRPQLAALDLDVIATVGTTRVLRFDCPR